MTPAQLSLERLVARNPSIRSEVGSRLIAKESASAIYEDLVSRGLLGRFWLGFGEDAASVLDDRGRYNNDLVSLQNALITHISTRAAEYGKIQEFSEATGEWITLHSESAHSK